MKINRLLVKLSGLVFLSLTMLQITGCSSMGGYGSDGKPSGYFNAESIPDAVPKAEPRSKYGNPSSYRVGRQRYHVMKNANGYDKKGYASWYGRQFHGRRTSSSERYDMYSMTAASPTLPIPTYVRVTNLENGRNVIVKINDRGPFHSKRIIDLSYAAAKKLGYASKGTAYVHVTAINTDKPKTLLAAKEQPPSANVRMASTPVPKQLAKNNRQYLQVGAYQNRAKAVTASKKIAALTQVKVAIKETTRQHSKVYRLHIGPLANEDKSMDIQQILVKNGFGKPINVAG